MTKRSIQIRIFAFLFATILAATSAFAEKGDDNPTGVAGAFNGNIVTGCNYDGYTGNGLRQVDDIVVQGAVGARPLKWTRYFNTHVTADNNYVGAQWRFSYISYIEKNSQGTRLTTLPDGRQLTDQFGTELFEDAQGIHLEDGSIAVPGSTEVDPYGQTTTIITSGTGANKRTTITEHAGRQLLVSYNADGTVSKVEAFDGINGHAAMQSVTYTWTPFTLQPPGGGTAFTVPTLTRVDYSDGTFATYTYTQRTFEIRLCSGLQKFDHFPVAELATANDVRYLGPMRQIAYTYTNPSDQTNPGHNGTRVLSENHLLPNGQIGEMVSTIAGLSENGTSTSTETRGDSRTRSFTYNSVTRCIPCPPPDTDPCADSQPLDGKLLSFTDFQGNSTVLSYETDATKPSAGFITAVKDANNNTTTYTRSNLSWAILRVTHPPTASEPQGSHIDQTFTDETLPYYLSSRTDENFHTTIYHRDDPANPNAITEKDYADGTLETFAYNNFGQVLTHRMRNGAYQHFSYDSRGLLLAKTNPTWTGDRNTSLASDPQATYTYYTASDYNGAWTDRVKTETDPRGLVTQYEYDHTFDSNGNETTTPAGSRGLVTKLIHVSDNTYQSFGYNKYGDKLWEENELRKRTSYDPDDYGRVVKVTNPLLKFITNDYTPSNNASLSPYVHTTNAVYKTTTPTGIVTQNMFDENFRKISTTVGAQNSSDAATTWFQYDFVGNPTKVTDPRGSGSGDAAYTTTTDYDQRNRKWHVTDPLGHVTTFGYDPASNNNTITRSDQTVETKTYNEVNQVLTDKVPKSGTSANVSEYVTTTFEYYPSSVQMAGQLWHASQLLTESQTGARRTTEFQYDPAGMKTKMLYPLDDAGGTNPNEYQAWTYDPDHNLLARRTVNGVSQLFSYDDRNRQSSMTWSNALDWATFGYDAASRMTSAQNPTSIITRGYDDANRLTLDRQQLQIMPIRAVSRKMHGSAGTFDVTLPLTGTPGVECRVGQGANSDQHQIVVTFPRAITYSGAAVTGSATIASRSTSYDGTQVTLNLSGVSNAQTIIVTLSSVSDGSVTNDVSVGMGVLLGDVDGSGVVDGNDVSDVQSLTRQTTDATNYRYDVDVSGRIDGNDVSIVQNQTRTRVPSYNLHQPVPSSPSIDVQYSYDDDGKNVRLYATSTGAGTAGYDLTFGYNDGLGRFKTISQTGQLFQYGYDKASNETSRTGPNGLTQVYGRDSLNRMTSRTINQGSSAVSVEVYVYDPNRAGLLTSVTHQEGSTAATHDAFGYDLLPELNSAQYNLAGAATQQAADLISQIPILAGGVLGSFNPPTPPNRNVNYAWDRAGNRTGLTDSAGPSYNYLTNSLNQYTTDGISNMGNGSEHELASYQAVNYSYINDSHVWLVAGTDVFGQQSRYEMYYDALGRRCVSILNGSTTYYIYDGEKAILEYRGWSGGPSAANVYGKSIDEILKRTDYTVTPNSVVYYQDDHEGSITHLTDASGNIIEYYRYDAFGKPTIYGSNGSPLNPQVSIYHNRFMFTGREYVETFGIYEYRNRAYHPALGRFMSEDPKLFDSKDYNLFRYVGNDPLDRVDPMGLYFGVDDAILAGGGSLLGLGGQGLEDLLSGQFSGWQAYTGAAVGGAVGAWSSEYIGPVLGAAAGSATANATKQGLRIASGAQHGFNTRELAVQTGVGVISSKFPAPKIAGVNAGRNSYNAIAKQMETKLQNGTITNVSAKTAAKMAVPGAANDIAHTAAEAHINAAARSVEANTNQSGNSNENVTGHVEFSVGRDPSTGRINTPLLINGVPQQTPPPIRTTSEEFVQPR